MSATRTATGALRLLKKEAQICLQKPRAMQSRSLSSTPQTPRTQQLSTLQSQYTCFGNSRGVFESIRTTQGRRNFSASSAASHGVFTPPKPGEEVYVTFVDKEGEDNTFAVNVGDDLLTVAQEFDVEMEGACEGSCSCSTCHVIVESEEMFDKLEEADDDENDMLDLAFGLTETSRLGCQIKMTKELDGLRVRLPKMTRNMQASDFSNK